MFISQCGLQSLTEAISTEVPVIGLPVLADQFGNIERLSDYGAGIGFDFKTVKAEEFKAVIIEVAENSKYAHFTKL